MAVNPYTGLDDGIGQLKNIVQSAGEGIESFLPQDAASRGALMQIGLNLMQPRAMGQTLGGHIAQAIGSGGEAVTRSEAADLEKRKADISEEKGQNALTIAQDRLTNQQKMTDIAQQRATEAAAARADRLELLRLQGRISERRANTQEKGIIDKRVNERFDSAVGGQFGINADPKYKGMDRDAIRQKIEDEEYIGAGLMPPSSVRTGGGTTPPTTGGGGEKPPVEGARKAPDGNWYVPDPDRPGKYKIVGQ